MKIVLVYFAYLTTAQLYMILGITFVLGLITYLIYGYYWNRVEGTSELIRKVIELNKKYVFYKGIKKQEKINRACSSKVQFDKTDLSKYFMGVMESSLEYFDTLFDKIGYNKKLFKEYNNEYMSLKTSANKELANKNKMPLFIYKLIEQVQYKKRKAKPSMDTEFIVRATYVSPKGKNAYHKNLIYSYDDTKKYLELVHLKIHKKETKQYQRSIMSDQLRYEILRRDGFKCQLCGATAEDGVKLHVDHIIPIAKGGKTIKSNLRVLCERCNLGKRDTLE